MAEQMEENGNFLNLLRLPYPAKTLIVSQLDYKSRRALRACSRDMHYWMETFLFFNVGIMDFKLEEYTAPDGGISYGLTNQFGHHMSGDTKHFEKAEELTSFLQDEVFKNVDYVSTLRLTITGLTSPIQLIKHRKVLKIGTLDLVLSGNSGVVTALENQIHPESLKVVCLKGEGLDQRAFGTLKPRESLILQNVFVNDASLLSIRARHVSMFKADGITVVGLKEFCMKMLQYGETTRIYIWELNDELENLFKYRERDETVIFHVSTDYSNHSIKITYTGLPHYYLTFRAELVSRLEAFLAEDGPEPDDEAIQNFIMMLKLEI